MKKSMRTGWDHEQTSYFTTKTRFPYSFSVNFYAEGHPPCSADGPPGCGGKSGGYSGGGGGKFLRFSNNATPSNPPSVENPMNITEKISSPGIEPTSRCDGV